MHLWGVLAASDTEAARSIWESIDLPGQVIAAVIAFIVTAALTAISKHVRAAVFWVFRQLWRVVRGIGFLIRWLWRSRPVSRRRFDALEQRVDGTRSAPRPGGQGREKAVSVDDRPEWKKAEPRLSESSFPVQDRHAAARGALETTQHPWAASEIDGRTLVYLEDAWPYRNVVVVSVAGSSLPVAETFGEVPGYSVLRIQGDKSGQQIHTVSISWDTEDGWPARAEMRMRPA
jgi:hypothetical protein